MAGSVNREKSWAKVSYNWNMIVQNDSRFKMFRKNGSNRESKKVFCESLMSWSDGSLLKDSTDMSSLQSACRGVHEGWDGQGGLTI